MLKNLTALILIILLAACGRQAENGATPPSTADSADYKFVGGYPTAQTVQDVYDEADLNRAIMTYRFFYPSVSILGTWEGNLKGGVVPNKVFPILDGSPQQLVFTPNSDTRYAALVFDLSKTGPMVIEIPSGPYMAVANDLNQLYVMDLGLPGPDKGKGGKHLLIPPGYTGNIPQGYHTGKSTTNRVLLLVRAIPVHGGEEAAEAMIKSVKTYPLNKPADWTAPTWVSLNKPGLDFTPLSWEDNIKYWEKLHELISTEPPYEPYRVMYGELAELGIERGKPFNPDDRMKNVLERAAKTGNAFNGNWKPGDFEEVK